MLAVMNAELPYTFYSDIQESPIDRRFISEEMLIESLRLSVRHIEDNFEISQKIVEDFISHPINVDDDRMVIDTLEELESKCEVWLKEYEKVQKETPIGERYNLNLQIMESIQKYKEVFQDLRWKLLVRDGMMDLK